MMDKIQLQKLRDLPIEGVAERLGLQVCRHKSLCPFHDDHKPSLTFSVARNTFRCWSCGEHGGTIDLALKLLPLGGGREGAFLEACKWLANEHNVILTEYKPSETKPAKPFDNSYYERFFLHPFLNAEARRFLFEERRLDPRVVRWCRLTSWCDKQGIPWLQIPYYNKEGKLVGVQNRNLVMGGLPRFRFPTGSKCSIYNLPILNTLSPGEALYIAEGCSDCWALLSAGHKAIAIPSATLLKKKDAEQLLRLSLTLRLNLHMYPDRDEPGERLFLQLREILPGLEHHQLPPDCKDYSDYYLKLKMKN
jgi:DNA primase